MVDCTGLSKELWENLAFGEPKTRAVTTDGSNNLVFGRSDQDGYLLGILPTGRKFDQYHLTREEVARVYNVLGTLLNVPQQ